MAGTVTCEVDGEVSQVSMRFGFDYLECIRSLLGHVLSDLHDCARLLLHYLICHTCKYPGANDASVLGLFERDLLVSVR